jgi:hypothetical protein
MNPQDLIAAFFNTGQIMAGQIQPYARGLIGLLILVEVLTRISHQTMHCP